MSRRLAKSDVLLGLTGKCADSTRVIAVRAAGATVQDDGGCAGSVSPAGRAGRRRAARDLRALPVPDGWSRRRVRAGRPRRRQDARPHAVPGPALERQDLPLRADAHATSTTSRRRRCPTTFARSRATLARSAGMTLDAGPLHHELLRRRGPDGPAPGQGREPSARSPRALPVVSVSLGDTARFLFGGAAARPGARRCSLESGDAFVFGGPARLRYHGVSRILPGTAPPELGLDGRFNLTFRSTTCNSPRSHG